MPKLRLLAPLALCLGLAGCAGIPVVGYGYVSDNYRPQMLNYAAARGGMLAEVVGNPFDVEKAAIDRQVTRTLEQSHFGPPLAFFSEEPPDYRSPYRVVWVFNPAPNANGAKLCSRPDRPQAEPQQGVVGILASFCSSDARITSASGSLRGTTGPGDPAFQKLLTQVSLQLFPPQYQDQNDRDREFF